MQALMEYLIHKVYVHYFSADKISLQPLSLFRKWINKSKERSILVQIMLLKVQMQLHRSVMCHFCLLVKSKFHVYICVCVYVTAANQGQVWDWGREERAGEAAGEEDAGSGKPFW